MYECVPGAEKSPNLIDALVFVNHITKYNQNDKNYFSFCNKFRYISMVLINTIRTFNKFKSHIFPSVSPIKHQIPDLLLRFSTLIFFLSQLALWILKFLENRRGF